MSKQDGIILIILCKGCMYIMYLGACCLEVVVTEIYETFMNKKQMK